jgi:hypothetical protein
VFSAHDHLADLQTHSLHSSYFLMPSKKQKDSARTSGIFVDKSVEIFTRNGPFVLGLVARLRNASPGLVAAKTDAAVVPFHFEVHAFYLGSRRDAAVR